MEKTEFEKKQIHTDLTILPVEQGVVKVFTEALQHPVMIPDGGSLIFTGRKVTLQLRDTKTDPVAELFIMLGQKK